MEILPSSSVHIRAHVSREKMWRSFWPPYFYWDNTLLWSLNSLLRPSRRVASHCSVHPNPVFYCRFNLSNQQMTTAVIFDCQPYPQKSVNMYKHSGITLIKSCVRLPQFRVLNKVCKSERKQKLLQNGASKQVRQENFHTAELRKWRATVEVLQICF